MTAVEDIGTLIVHLATSVMVIVKIGKVATVITVDEGTGGVRLADSIDFGRAWGPKW